MYLIFKVRSVDNNAYWDGFLSVLKGYSRRGLFLEIGASNIEQVDAHSKLFDKLIGLDFEFSGLPQRKDIPLINADAQYLPFKDNTFNGVISHHVIEHVPDDRLFLDEIKRVLKKGGFGIIGTPNRTRLSQFVLEAFKGKRNFPWFGHMREYTKEELLKVAQGIGFDRVSAHAWFFGIHLTKMIFGLGRMPVCLEKWCNFLFLEIVK